MTNPYQATDMPEAIRENRARMETGRPAIGDDLFGAWEDDPEGIWAGLRPRIEREWPDLDPQDLDATDGRPSEVLDLIGQHTGLGRDAATSELERLLAVRDHRA